MRNLQRKYKHPLFFVMGALLLLCGSCQALDRWLFGASDYSIRQESDREVLDDENIYWDDIDYDIWYDEYEYE